MLKSNSSRDNRSISLLDVTLVVTMLLAGLRELDFKPGEWEGGRGGEGGQKSPQSPIPTRTPSKPEVLAKGKTTTYLRDVRQNSCQIDNKARN